MNYAWFIYAIVAYLLGSINTSILISKIFGVSDIRQHGSGNAGATNTIRVLGKKAGVLVVIGDALKGVVAVLLAKYAALHIFGGNWHYAIYIAADFVVIGHIFPLYFKFKGGKGIMTSISVLFVLDPAIATILLSVFLVLVICFNYISLGSCVASVLLPLTAWYIYGNNKAFLLCCIVITLLTLWKHKSNIIRLIHGTESKFIVSKK